MSQIKILLAGNHKIVLEGIASMLTSTGEAEIISMLQDHSKIDRYAKNHDIHVLIMHNNPLQEKDLSTIEQINKKYPRIRILVLCFSRDETLLFKTIKAGANGFLNKDADRSELLEAVYTLRNGYDYFSKSISTVLLKQYILEQKNDTEDSPGKKLSNREVEVLKQVGEGLTNLEIADRLCISIRTVESHKNHIMQKLNLRTTVDLVKFAIKNNIISI